MGGQGKLELQNESGLFIFRSRQVNILGVSQVNSELHIGTRTSCNVHHASPSLVGLHSKSKW